MTLCRDLVSSFCLHVTHCTLHRHCTLTSFLVCLLSFSRLSTDRNSSVVQYSLTSVCAHIIWIEKAFSLQTCFQRNKRHLHDITRLLMSYMVAARRSEKLQVHWNHVHKELSPMERAFVRDFVGTCSQVHSECEHRECAVDMHVPPIKGTPRVKFKVLDGTEPTLSMLDRKELLSLNLFSEKQASSS